MNALRILTVSLCVGLVGCGSTEVEKVTGRVLLNGEPCTGFCVCLYPTKNLNLGVLAAYAVEEQGDFTILPRPNLGQLGLAGDYVGLIHDNQAAPPRMDPKYSHAHLSPLHVTVGKGVTDLDEFDLEPNRHALCLSDNR